LILSLPANLESAIGQALRELPTSQWMSAARALSARYRAERGSTPHPLARGDAAALGYAAMILPAAYAQLSGAMAAVVERVPSWAPVSILDIGSGPGTALWAAVEHWSSLQSLTAWEREPAFISLARQLARASDNPAISEAHWEQVTLGGTFPRNVGMYDLVVLGHVLNELDESLQREVVSFAWEHCAGVLLIVEPGTSAAFPNVRNAREQLLNLGAKTLAPCAHDVPCPLVGDWCHFPQKLHRPAYQRRVKEGSAGWEESKFSYAAISKFAPDKTIWGRLIHQPHVSKIGVVLTVSSREGIVKPRVSKRHRELYRQLSDLRWGEVLADPLPDKQPAKEV
jgi:ribosomal protein RSM22 (predicted rRNA methylase)